MKNFIALTIAAFASHATFAGEQVDQSLVAPAPPTSASFFRSNELSVGFFGSYLDTYGDNTQGIALGEAVWKRVTSISSTWDCQLMVMRLVRLPATIAVVR